jgi:hypothetical protein
MGCKLSGKTRCEISFSAIEKNSEEFIKLVSEPKFVCKKCCRVSADKKYLCKAKKLNVSGETMSRETATA